VSRTLPTSAAQLYALTAEATRRKKWFPRGPFEATTHTESKAFRGRWNEDARLELAFIAKGEGKAQITATLSKLAKKADVETQRAVWKSAFDKLAILLAA
jgi:hypothetical protein